MQSKPCSLFTCTTHDAHEKEAELYVVRAATILTFLNSVMDNSAAR